ncbi:uncharacterized protein LOC144827359 [Lissotriton helveticus]
MPRILRTQLKNGEWAQTMLDSAAEVSIARKVLMNHLETVDTNEYLQVETADTRVSKPHKIYEITLRIEGDKTRKIRGLFWDNLSKGYDILLAEKDWPPEFVRECPHGEEVIMPAFSNQIPIHKKYTLARKWAVALAPALYKNHVGWDEDSPPHKIQLKSQPTAQRQYPIKQEAKKQVNEILDQLEYQGVIETCTSQMNNPLFPVSKPDNSYRLVLDYRHLNTCCKTFAVQNSHSAALMNNIVRKKYKTTLDISNGFFCQNIAPESRYLTAFSVNGTQKQFCRLAQGYKNSPGVFSARVTELLQLYDDEALSYVDDIYLTDDDLETHLKRVNTIILGFAAEGYKFNFKKSRIAHLTVLFLGYELSSEGKSLADNFLEKCAVIQAPKTLKNLQSILGFLNFGRTYIANYAERVKPLYDLIKPDFKRSSWTQTHTEILRSLQTDMLIKTKLETRDNTRNLVIRVIPGKCGFTYLTSNEGEKVPITFKSHLYTKAEQRFSNKGKMVQAVQTAIAREKDIADGRHITVRTAESAFEALTTPCNLPSTTLDPEWIQWVNSITTDKVYYYFDPELEELKNLKYEKTYPLPIDILPLRHYACVIYTDGHAQPSVWGEHAYNPTCEITKEVWRGGILKPLLTKSHSVETNSELQTEIIALKMALDNADREFPTLIVSDSYFCVKAYNKDLQTWIQNGYKDDTDAPIRQRLLWEQIALLKKELPKTHVTHSLSHQRDGVHVVGNSLAETAAAAATKSAPVDRKKRKLKYIDGETLLAVKTSSEGDCSALPINYPLNYTYIIDVNSVPFARIPGVGDRVIPNMDRRNLLIADAHMGEGHRHLKLKDSLEELQSRYWWPGMSLHYTMFVKNCPNCNRDRSGERSSLIPRRIKADNITNKKNGLRLTYTG